MHYLVLYLIAWFPMVVLAVINGTIREAGYGRQLTELKAHQISTYILLGLFLIYFSVLFYFFPLDTFLHSVYTGLLWLVLTFVFETGLSLFEDTSINQTFSDYNFFKGRLWSLVLLWVAIAPMIFYFIYR